MLLLLKSVARHDAPDKKCVQLAIKEKPKNTTICARFLHCCTLARGTNVKCVDMYNRYLKWAEENNEPAITKTNLFIELKKTVSYNKSVYFDGKKTTAFIGIALI